MKEKYLENVDLEDQIQIINKVLKRNIKRMGRYMVKAFDILCDEGRIFREHIFRGLD